MPTAELTIAADLSSLRKQLESLPGITAEQAKNMTAELNRSFKSAERAAASAAKATKASMDKASAATREAADAAKGLGDRFGSVGSGAGRLAGALDMLAPGLGGVGQGIADLADVGEVAAGSLGSLAAPAVGVLAAAAIVAVPTIMHLTAEMNAEAEAARVMGLANDYARQQLELQRTAALDLAVATGQLTESERTDAEVRHQAALGLETFLEGLRETSLETLQAEAGNRAIIQSLVDLYTYMPSPISAALAFARAIGLSVPTSEELTESIGKFLGVLGKYEAGQVSNAAATEKATAATKRTRDAQLSAASAKDTHTSSTDKLTTSVKKSAEALAAEAAAAQLQRDASDLGADVQAIMNEEFARTSTEAEKLTLRMLDLQEQQASLAQSGADIDVTAALEVLGKQREEALAKQGEAERAAEEKRRADALAAEFAFYESRAKIATDAADVVAAYTTYQLEQETQAYQDALDAREALGENASKAAKARAADEVREAKKQAAIAFYIDKAAKLAQAITATALATINALALPPAPNYIAAGLAATGGAVQVATIAAARPSFHSGGMVDMAPDEASAVVRRGEAVLSPAGRRAIGDDTIRAANAGTGTGQTIVVQQVYRHRVFDSFLQDNLRTRGPLARALGTGARTGQRR